MAEGQRKEEWLPACREEAGGGEAARSDAERKQGGQGLACRCEDGEGQAGPAQPEAYAVQAIGEAVQATVEEQEQPSLPALYACLLTRDWRGTTTQISCYIYLAVRPRYWSRMLFPVLAPLLPHPHVTVM